jgi:thiol-disulfide isomerase/thioredoxin
MRVLSIGACVGLVWLSVGVPARAQEMVDVPEATVPAAAQHDFEQGRDYETRRQLSAAVDSYHAAMKAAGGACLPCLDAVVRTQMKMEAYKDAAGSAMELAKDAPDAKSKAAAEYREGMAWYQLYFAESEGEGGIDKNVRHAAEALKHADDALQRATADDATDETARMLYARVLAAEKRDEDASKEFAACAAMPGLSQKECERALRFSKDVGEARNEPAPKFNVTAIDGSKVTLDSLSGKVVLVDFWATWCPVCLRDSDYIQTMVDEFDPKKFVLLEVDAHEDEAKWKNYVEDHRLEGLETRDADGAVADAFHVGGYPTYVVLDGEGVMRLRAVGIEGDLKGEVRKLIEEQKADAGGTPKPVSKVAGE